MKRILAILLLASSALAGEPSAQYVDQIDKPTPISNAKHEASLKAVKEAANSIPDYRYRYNYVHPPIIYPTNYAATAAKDRKQRSRPTR